MILATRLDRCREKKKVLIVVFLGLGTVCCLVDVRGMDEVLDGLGFSQGGLDLAKRGPRRSPRERDRMMG